VPIYEAAGKGRLPSRFFRRAVYAALESLAGVDDPLPPGVTAPLGLLPRWEAFRNAHFPAAGARLADLDDFRSPAQVRLIFEEFFLLETGLALKRKRARELPGIAFRTDARIRECLKKILPFRPTAAQKRALGEIVEDMRAPRPMHRLLQGDVGSGKTIVALQAAVIAIENGCQVVVMAPTEILAAQHFYYFRRLLERSGYTPVLLSGSSGVREKRAIKKLLREGAAQIAIGTHALVEEDVEFKALGLVIIDEQHRFGVMQRLRLMRKTQAPDTLVMTATPIPRTLALTIYGDLDVSILDEMPAGRRPVVTRQVPEERASEAYELVRTQVRSGAQAFIVCPVIEDAASLEGDATAPAVRSRASGLKSALQVHQYLSKVVFPEFPVGLLHGRLSGDEKEKTMAAFQAGALPILVGTTVLEVGVDVPRASVMVVESADRFGLAQLHQLRGRVGRGTDQSYAALVSTAATTREWEGLVEGRLTPTTTEQARLIAVQRTTDGFELAEKDWELRREGNVLGLVQSGLPQLRVASLQEASHRDLATRARDHAEALLDPAGGIRRGAEALDRELSRGWLARVFAGDPGGSA
ncbi:MAG: ATP-dependent DNA helicase RecG, partial [Candidatus Rokuibacteriota bacterium]